MNIAEHPPVYLPLYEATTGTLEFLPVISLSKRSQGGGINDVFIGVSPTTSTKYIWREDRGNTSIQRQIYQEYMATGLATERSKSFRIRNHVEQLTFAQNAADHGLQVVIPHYFRENGLMIPFVESVSLETYLKNGGIEAIGSVFDDLFSAHTQGIVYGDRWPKNILVLPNGKSIKHIDFDIELQGEHAKDQELGQFIWGCVSTTNNPRQMAEYITHYLENSQNMQRVYDISFVVKVLTAYFTNHNFNSHPSHAIKQAMATLYEFFTTYTYIWPSLACSFLVFILLLWYAASNDQSGNSSTSS